MKWAISIILLLMVACKGTLSKNTNVTSRNIDSIKKSVNIYPDRLSDTIYKVGTFLIPCKKDMRIAVINKKHPTTLRFNKADTLYEDKDTIVLDYYSKLRSEGLYKRYTSKYNFSMFKVNDVYKGSLAAPNFKSDRTALYYRTAIREDCKDSGVNFAGHYTIVEWGMGCMAEGMAIVDRITGNICFSKIPFDTVDGHYGVKYNKDSKMLIVNSSLLEDYPGYSLYNGYRKVSVYVWENSNFKRIE